MKISSGFVYCNRIDRKVLSLIYPAMSFFFYSFAVVTGRNEVVAKVMFLHVSVILYTGGVYGEHHHPPGPGIHPPSRKNPPPPGTKENSPDQADPPGPRGTPRPGRHPPDQGEPPPRPGRHTHPPRTRQTPPLPPGKKTAAYSQ